jgi:homoserine acetyltransferase
VSVELHEVASPYGHDSFLLDVPEYLARVQRFVGGLAAPC